MSWPFVIRSGWSAQWFWEARPAIEPAAESLLDTGALRYHQVFLSFDWHLGVLQSELRAGR